MRPQLYEADVVAALEAVGHVNREDDELYDAIQTILTDRDACKDIAIALNGGPL